ncbi:hypothetical protein AXG93_1962s1150 [Marchantia polymorpha subsp. ruderalis]|uniref:Integrase catalytic domain-containing protein n=1 Tax=Marchantia polymorpha subsp. ruderalis TaxID=1480154 RepID=A0A176WDE4_MARPO|nr:hypothetical protein AXG93_1962s1150 [Marchantia polymorpha subsp. ruderalis]
MSSLERGVELVPIVAEVAGILHSDDESEESSFLSEDPVEIIPERLQPIKPMALSKVGGPRFEVERFDGRTDYLLWERQVKNVIKAMGLRKDLKPKPLNVDDEDWNEIQDQAVNIVTLYLKPNVLKQVEELSSASSEVSHEGVVKSTFHIVKANELQNGGRYVWIYFLPHNFEVFVTFKKWKAQVETQTGEKVKFLQSDNSGEYVSQEFGAFCEHEGVTRHFTNVYTPQQNGVSERLNRTLLDRSWSMLSHAGLPQIFWAKAINTAAYLAVNLLLVEMFLSMSPDHQKKGKIVNPATNEGYLSSPNTIEGEIYHAISHDGPQGGAPQMTGEAEEQDFVLEEVHEEQHIAGEPPPKPTHSDQPESSTARPTRVLRAPERYGTWFPTEHDVRDEDLLVDDSGEALITEDGSPSSYAESQSVPEKLDWDAAMRKEMKSLHDNQTWELVELAAGKRAIDCKWVYTVKDGSTDAVEKIFKSRLMAKGFEQRNGIDYTEVFSPIAKFSTICLLCALVTLFGLFLHQMDVVRVFLHGALDEVIYMRQPKGFLKRGK